MNNSFQKKNKNYNRNFLMFYIKRIFLKQLNYYY